jgi:hypothetical protein
MIATQRQRQLAPPTSFFDSLTDSSCNTSDIPRPFQLANFGIILFIHIHHFCELLMATERDVIAKLFDLFKEAKVNEVMRACVDPGSGLTP